MNLESDAIPGMFMSKNHPQNSKCEKCGDMAVDIGLICQSCGWDHFFKEYVKNSDEEALEEYKEDTEDED